MRHVLLPPCPRPAYPALVLVLSLSATACMDLDFSGMCLFDPCGGSSGSEVQPTLSFSVQPTEVTAGAPIVPAVEVSALDWRGQLDPVFTGLVVLHIEGPNGVPVDSASAMAHGGIALFDSLTIELPRTGYRLWATAVGHAPGISTPFTVTPAGAVVDQQQGLMDGSSNRWALGGLASQTLAQVVTAGISGALVAVRFPVACEADLTLEIRGVTGDGPGDSVLTAETYPPNSVPYDWTNAFYTLVLQTPVSFAAGERLAIVLRSAGACSVARGPEGDSYSGGNGFLGGGPNGTGTWLPLGVRADLPFQTLVR